VIRERRLQRRAVVHVEDSPTQHNLIALGGHRGRRGPPGDQLEPEVVEHHTDALEERRLVALGQLGAQRTAQPPQDAEDQLLLAHRIEVGRTVEDRFALGPEDDARGEDVPLNELTGGQALAHTHALVRPQV
jgi:hypothetical protein